MKLINYEKKIQKTTVSNAIKKSIRRKRPEKSS